MANSLWIDTSGAYCSLGLRVGEQEFVHSEFLNRTHNQKLLGLLDGLFETAGVSPRALDVLGFACGPGSFTGVRMAASAVQAIAASADCGVIAVKTIDALFLSSDSSAESVCAIKSRGEAYYLCRPDSEPQLWDTCPDWVSESGRQR